MVGHKKEEFVLGLEEGEKYVEVICIIMEERKEEKGTYIMGEERERCEVVYVNRKRGWEK